jgi:hypothetical protein
MMLLPRMAVNSIYKCITFPTVIYGASRILPSYLLFSSWIAVAVLSGIFILIGVFADETILPLLGISTATIQGSLFMIGFTWIFPYLYPGNDVKLGGAVFIGVVLGCVEFAMHLWIRKQQDVRARA